MTLYAFRLAHPGFRPNRLATHRDGRTLELISYPWDESEGGKRKGSFVMARVPNDPATMEEFSTTELTPC